MRVKNECGLCIWWKDRWGLAWLPLLIHTDLHSYKQYIPTYILHHTTRMLLERHSKINIFTQKKKEINKLRGSHPFKSLRSLLSPCHVIARHCQQPRQARAPQAVCHRTVFVKGSRDCQKASGGTVPHSHWAWESSLWLQLFPVGTLLSINRTQRQSTLDGLILPENGPSASHACFKN